MKVKAINPLFKKFALLAFSFTALPALIFYWYYIGSDLFIADEPEVLITLVTPLIIQFSGIPSEAVTTMAIVIPAWLSAVALSPEQETLTRVQKVAIAMLIFSILLNLSVVIFFSGLDNVFWRENLVDGDLFIPKVIQGADMMYKAAFAYLLFIWGLQNQVENKNEA